MHRLWILLLFGLLFAGCNGDVTPNTGVTTRSGLRGAVFDPPRVLDDFTLDSSTGTPFKLSEHAGEVILLYFGYRSCPDFCPTTFAELRRVYAAVDEPADQLKIAMVTVDPERDTVENLALYTQTFHEDFIGLRAEGDVLDSVMRQFGVVAEKQQAGDGPFAYLMDHTATLFLIGQDGTLQAQYLFGTDYQDITHDVEQLLAEA